jgi:hypothetical protein
VLSFLRRRLTDLGAVRFCEACAEVCTPQCRSQTRLDTAHTRVNQQQYQTIR